MTLAMLFFGYLAEVKKNSFTIIDYKLVLNYKEMIFSRRHLTYLFLLFLSFLFPFLIASLRFNVGTDYGVYYEKYIPAALSGNYESVELMYYLLIHLGDLLWSYQGVYILTHLIILLFIYRAISKLSVSIVLSLLIFAIGGYFNISLNVMRQSITFAIFLYSIQYIINKDLKKYILFTILASLFHSSALLYLPLYFFFRINFLLRTKITLLILSFSMYIFLPIIRMFVIWISSTFSFYTSYFNSIFDVQSNNYIFVVLNASILFLAIFVESKYPLSNKTIKVYNIFFNIQLLALIFSILSPIIPNANRIIPMFSIVQILFVPFLVKKINGKYTKVLVLTAIIVGYISVFLKMYYFANSGETFPYTSIFNK